MFYPAEGMVSVLKQTVDIFLCCEITFVPIINNLIVIVNNQDDIKILY